MDLAVATAAASLGHAAPFRTHSSMASISSWLQLAAQRHLEAVVADGFHEQARARIARRDGRSTCASCQ
jgi:hypothetical protein